MLRTVGFLIFIASVLTGCEQTQQANAGAATPTATLRTMPGYPDLRVRADKVAVYRVEGNYGKFIDNLHPKLVEAMGGKENMLDSMIKDYERLNLEGSTQVAMVIGEPSQIEEVGGQIFAVMPVRTTTKSLEGDLVADGSIVGVSDDNGKNWKFIADVDQAMFRTHFADGAQKIQIAATKPPALIKQ